MMTNVATDMAQLNDDEATPWLDDEEQQAWRAYLRGARALEVALDRQLSAVGFSLAEYEILSMLSEAPERQLRMSALADRVVQSRSRMTHTATRLEGRGLVTRQACAKDARGIELKLTNAGMAALERAARLHVRGVREYLVNVMPREQFLVLGDAMAKVRESIDAPRRD